MSTLILNFRNSWNRNQDDFRLLAWVGIPAGILMIILSRWLDFSLLG